MQFTNGQPIEHGTECPFSTVTVLAEERGATLEHVSDGARIAGSIRTYQTEHWRMAFYLDGSRHSRGFKTESEAREAYERRVSFLRGLA